MRHVLFSLSLFALLSCGSGSGPKPCPAGSTRCGSACVDPLRDPSHCGGCGARCEAGLLCEQGACVPSCTRGLEACGASCRDLGADPLHCGACGRACAAGEACHEGRCLPACPPGTERCGEMCVDTQSDAAHCGGCDAACPEQRVCEAGQCRCEAPLLACGEGCVDPREDVSHCGGCDRTCEGSCVAGVCLCPEGLTNCDGRCVDTDRDFAHCGGCDQRCEGAGPNSSGGACSPEGCRLECAAGYRDCDGSAATGCETWVVGDEDNCGHCGLRCADRPHVAASEGCFLERCLFVCEAGWEDCDGDSRNGCEAEMDTLQHCGACFRNCHALPNVQQSHCEAGECVIVACMPGFADCNGDPMDGCETGPSDGAHSDGVICPVPVEVRSGWAHTCARLGTGQIWCWGSNSGGSLGEARYHVPQRPGWGNAVEDAIALAVGNNHNCVIDRDRRLRCWGSNYDGELGNGSREASARPTVVTGLAGVREVAAGQQHTCAIDGEGKVWCWGKNTSWQLGNSFTSRSPLPMEVKGLRGLEGIRNLRLGAHHSCVLARPPGETEERAFCWGAGESGQLGHGIFADSADPVGPAQAFVQVVTGHGFTCGLQPEAAGGGVWCWGSNGAGQLGAGLPTGLGNDRASPVQVVGLGKVRELVAGAAFACALEVDGGVACWGANFEGNLAVDPQIRSLNEAQPIAPLSNLRILQLSAGVGHACAVVEGNELWCWGDNFYGQLGDGSTEDRHLPVRVPW